MEKINCEKCLHLFKLMMKLEEQQLQIRNLKQLEKKQSIHYIRSKHRYYPLGPN